MQDWVITVEMRGGSGGLGFIWVSCSFLCLCCVLPLSVHEQRPEIAKKLKLMNTELSKGIVKTDSQDMKVKIRSEGLDCENIQAPNI